MRIIIDIGHPAHIHLFKNLAWEMQNKGHDIFFTCREKEFEIELLKHYGFYYKSFGRKYNTALSKLFGLIEFLAKEFIQGLKFKPDIFLSHGSIYAAHAAWLLRKPHIALEDTFNMEQVRLYMPFTDVVITGDYLHPNMGKKEIRYKGNHELAYLHPNVFTPDERVLEELGLKKDEKYAVVRFVAWCASHDLGYKGFSYENKIRLLEELSKYLRVFISSESELPNNFKQYQIKIRPEEMHDALYYANLFIGEGATMASESAVLGTPAICLYQSFGYLEDEAAYGLVHIFDNLKEEQGKAIDKAIELLKDPDLKENMKENRTKFLNDKIDVTAFMVWFIENYPESFTIMKENPDYQYNFK